jgi:predicted metalloprotease with PDZ domain
MEVMYSRGFTFMVKMDGLIRQATEDKASLDCIALDLLEKRRSHQKTRQSEWIAPVAKVDV